MEDFKIDIFSEENKGKSFPEFKSLSEKQCLQIKSAFFEKSKLDESITVIGLLDWLRSSATLIPDLNADTEIFNLLEIIRSVSTSKPDYVNINWYQFDDIDKFKIEDLSNYFKYIWYPGPDDVEIFPDDLSWVILIDATGSVFIYKFSQLSVV